MTPFEATRIRYPLKAKLAVLAASVGFLVELAVLALCMMPLIPLVPVFILIVFGNAFVLADVVRWAAAQATPKSSELVQPVAVSGARGPADPRRTSIRTSSQTRGTQDLAAAGGATP